MENHRHPHHPHIPPPHFVICRSYHHLDVLAVGRPLFVVVGGVDADADADVVGAAGAVPQLQRQQLVTL